MTLADAQALDRADPLRPLRERFSIPDGTIYLDGNSLGALPRSVVARTTRVVMEEWGRDLITSWNRHDWIDLPRRVGERIAPLIGAEPGTVVVADSTSLNIFKLLAVAVSRSGRKVIQTEAGNLPTDVYIAGGLASLTGHEVRVDDLSVIRDDVAVVLATEVNYRTGARHDMRALTERAHAAGAVVIWDLCHSAGAFPVDLAGAGADYAIGCGYKYLNGGPGAPAFAYVAPRHLAGLRTPLSGWLGHAAPFAFAADYEPAEGKVGRIAVAVRADGGRVLLEVGDNGPGIAPEDRARAVERFVRLEKSRTEPGSGLGLSLVAAVAKLHRGEFRIEDNAPGVRAVIDLPAAGA